MANSDALIRELREAFGVNTPDQTTNLQTRFRISTDGCIHIRQDRDVVLLRPSEALELMEWLSRATA